MIEITIVSSSILRNTITELSIAVLRIEEQVLANLTAEEGDIKEKTIFLWMRNREINIKDLQETSNFRKGAFAESYMLSGRSLCQMKICGQQQMRGQ